MALAVASEHSHGLHGNLAAEVEPLYLVPRHSTPVPVSPFYRPFEAELLKCQGLSGRPVLTAKGFARGIEESGNKFTYSGAESPGSWSLIPSLQKGIADHRHQESGGGVNCCNGYRHEPFSTGPLETSNRWR